MHREFPVAERILSFGKRILVNAGLMKPAGCPLPSQLSNVQAGKSDHRQRRNFKMWSSISYIHSFLYSLIKRSTNFSSSISIYRSLNKFLLVSIQTYSGPFLGCNNALIEYFYNNFEHRFIKSQVDGFKIK